MFHCQRGRIRRRDDVSGSHSFYASLESFNSFASGTTCRFDADQAAGYSGDRGLQLGQIMMHLCDPFGAMITAGGESLQQERESIQICVAPLPVLEQRRANLTLNVAVPDFHQHRHDPECTRNHTHFDSHLFLSILMDSVHCS